MNNQKQDTLSQISSILGFNFHKGADRSLEVNVVKAIMSRETKLMQLSHYCVGKSNNDSKILDLLMPLRDATINCVEAIELWRNSIATNNPIFPTPFMWDGINYILKMVNDVDFLANNMRFAFSIGLIPAKLRMNPLMLSNTLDDFLDVVDPFQRAGTDAGGKYCGLFFEERHRLRRAERVFLVELECAEYANAQQERDQRDQVVTVEPGRARPKSLDKIKTSKSSKPKKKSSSRKSFAVDESGLGSYAEFAFPIDDNVFSQPYPSDIPHRDRDVSPQPLSPTSTNNNNATLNLPSISKLDLELCSSVDNPTTSLQLAAAAVLILVSDGFEVRDDSVPNFNCIMVVFSYVMNHFINCLVHICRFRRIFLGSLFNQGHLLPRSWLSS